MGLGFLDSARWSTFVFRWQTASARDMESQRRHVEIVALVDDVEIVALVEIVASSKSLPPKSSPSSMTLDVSHYP
eukprot:3612904-Pyramimonas_sp.AAC.2